jgi:hypothetical protein
MALHRREKRMAHRGALIVAVMAAALLLGLTLWLGLTRKPEPPAPGAGVEKPSAPPVPGPETAAEPPIVLAEQGGPGCEPATAIFEAMVAAVGEDSLEGTTEKPLFLQDPDGVVRKYYLDLGAVPEDRRARLPEMIAVGQRLKVRYVTCGSGGFRYLTFLQPLATG